MYEFYRIVLSAIYISIQNIYIVHYNPDDLQPLIWFIVSLLISLLHICKMVTQNTISTDGPDKVKIGNTANIIPGLPYYVMLNCVNWVIYHVNDSPAMTNWFNYCIYTVHGSMCAYMRIKPPHHVWAQCQCHHAPCASAALEAGLRLLRKVSSVRGTHYFELALCLLLWPAPVSV